MTEMNKVDVGMGQLTIYGWMDIHGPTSTPTVLSDGIS